ncbi:MAG TPA: nucleotidyltransferase family protein [Candidatus Paceibacterota bacterium]|nr:nucleotidyltransferase family protein [Candidatus Paceibacterota bacterium]
MMKAVVLVGGLGTRLRPITFEIPKPLIPVKKRPILNHTIAWLRRHGISEVALLASRAHAEDFRRWERAWADELDGVKITTFFEEKPRGTLGGLPLVRAWMGSGPVVISNGDDLKDFDVQRMLAHHRRLGGLATVALFRVPDARPYGVPVLDGDRVVDFLEKPDVPPSDYVNGGLYVFDPVIFDGLDYTKNELMIERDLLPMLAKRGQLFAFRDAEARCYDCGTLERWEKAMREW